jgi:N-ethylmaleimide reductase
MKFPHLFSPLKVWGANRVGVRLSPYGIANDSGEPDPMPLYSYVVKSLDKLGLAYLHLIEPRSSSAGRAEVNWLRPHLHRQSRSAAPPAKRLSDHALQPRHFLRRRGGRLYRLSRL